MRRKRSYTAVDVEHFDLSAVLPLVTAGCIVAIDVAKTKFVAAIATSTGDVVKLVRFEHPRQTPAFLRMLEGLRDGGHTPSIVMEPTGTYGDAVRYQCVERGLPVHMMPPKHTHDFAEVLDGVPSMHDPKAAVVLAKLQAIKPARAWQPASEERRDLRAWVEQRTPIARTIALYHGHLEAMLARHWPEFGTLMDVHERRSWFALLQEFPGPHRVAIAGEAAMETLRKASRGNLGRDRLQRIVDAAKTTVGVPMTAGEEEKLRTVTEQIEIQTRRMERVDARLAELVQSDEVLSRMATVVGPACAASVGSLIGSPLDFTSARALEKPMGLNLKERSSGNKEGKLSLTKRGPAQVRQLMYMASLRLVKDDPIVVSWYRARCAYKAEIKTKAVVAVMRKLARALWHVARGDAFDATKLFDTRRLEVAPLKTVRRAESSTMSRSASCEGGAAIT